MNKILIAFLAAIAVALIGCNNEKEENVVNAEQQALPSTSITSSNDAASEQSTLPQAPPQEVAPALSQTAPIADSQNQLQPMPADSISGQQSPASEIPAASQPTMVTPQVDSAAATPPAVHGDVVPGSVTPATPGTGGLVMASEPTPTQNVVPKEKSEISQPVAPTLGA
jgi:hypothetical protein